MLVVMQSHATEEQIRVVCERIESLGLKAHPIPGSIRTAIGITGNNGAVDLGVLESLPGVIECIPVSKPYKLVSRDAKEEDSVLRIPVKWWRWWLGHAQWRRKSSVWRLRNA
jgi:3-deoxy-7-phosphoheptulonate synthase